MTTFAQPFHDYEILDRVGGGAMGTVFKARHKSLNRIVALKVLKPSLARDKRYVERLRREARIVASLSHPHIVTGYDLGEEGGYHFFVMEFVEGKSLRQLLVEWGMFPEEYVLRVAREVAEALDHAYQRGVIHRDIKPGNILIDESGKVKLTDMGLAKGPADMTLTRDGATVGTPQYISPEQARNPQDVDVRSDLYSLGATLYHMATGKPPFRGDTMAELITNVLHQTPVPPDEANSAVSAGVSLVIRKLLAKNLTVRYQTPRELLDDLDRIQKAQPPAVDLGRLESSTDDTAGWLKPVLYVLAAALLAAVAWWAGQQMREHRPSEPDAEQFLAALDADLRALPTPGARLQRLSTVSSMPLGTAPDVEQRRRVAAAELQRAVDGVAEQLLVADWGALERWFQDPTTWPDRERFEREHLQPKLRQVAGVTLAQLPSRVRLQGIDELQQRVERAIAARDGEFTARFEQFVATSLPASANERLSAGDFAGADRLWRTGLLAFCDGVRHPLPERLPEAVMRALEDRHRQASREADAAITRAETDVADALKHEVTAVVAVCDERLVEGVDPVVVLEVLERFRGELGQFWPAAPSFRIGRDPWPHVDQQLRAAEQRLELARKAALAARFEGRCDFAWRVFCRGSAADAEAVLADVATATAAQEQELVGMRRALRAAAQVERAVLAAIAQSPQPPVAFPLDGPAEPLELAVLPDGDGLRLVAQAVGRPDVRPGRAGRLTELRLTDLFDRLGASGSGPFRQLPRDVIALGTVVLRLVADDGAGLARDAGALDKADRVLAFDLVQPRIARVRDLAEPEPLDRDGLFAALARALQDLDAGQDSAGQLERALLACGQVPEGQCSERQRDLRRRAKLRLDLARRQRALADELAHEAPRGAGVDVTVSDGALAAAVALPAAVLQGTAGDGWQLRGSLLEFAGAGRPWSEQPLLALRASAGFDARTEHTRLECELVFPSAAVGRRLYLFESRGIGVALAVTADDGVHVALVDGDALQADRAQRAFERALLGVFTKPRALVVPGATHRLTIDVVVTKARTQAMVVVAFEGVELARELHRVDASLAPTAALHPLQEVAVQRLVLRADGL